MRGCRTSPDTGKRVNQLLRGRDVAVDDAMCNRVDRRFLNPVVNLDTALADATDEFGQHGQFHDGR
jgi:hypothetical protein